MQRKRFPRGNTLAMIAAVTVVLLVVIGFIVLYLSMMRSNSEHQTAIESAALAAAKDVSRIAINTPEFGWVALTTEAPTGTRTVAGDNYYQEVRSINELMATARLDMIIADALGDAFAKNMAIADCNNVKKVKDDLNAAIAAAVQPAGSGKDSNNNTLTPYLSAERVYMKNQAKGSNYVPGTLKLELGGVDGGIETATPAPVPLSKGFCSGMESNGHYLSEKNVAFQGVDFVFASVGKRVSLCEREKFRNTVPGLPYQMPAVVRVEASQEFTDQGKTWTTKFVACACAGGAEPARPTPGALTLSFPDGPVLEMTNPGEAISTVGGASMQVYEVSGGDFTKDKPAAGLTPYSGSIPFTTSPPSAVEVTELAFYDWVRCGGSRVNIDSILALQTLPFHAPSTAMTAWKAPDPQNPALIINLGNIPTGVMHIYTFNPDGTIKYVSKDIKPYPYTVVGDRQLYAEFVEQHEYTSDVAEWTIAGVPYIDAQGNRKLGEIVGTKKYDVFVRDLARNLGTISGGKHGGERMDGNPLISRGSLLNNKHELLLACADTGFSDPIGYGEGGGTRGSTTGGGSSNSVSGTSTNGGGGKGAPNMISRQDDFASSNIPAPAFNNYTQGPGGGAPRPTWSRNGLACDIRYRRQLKVGDLAFLIGGVETGYVGEMK